MRTAFLRVNVFLVTKENGHDISSNHILQIRVSENNSDNPLKDITLKKCLPVDFEELQMFLLGRLSQIGVFKREFLELKSKYPKAPEGK